MAMSDSDVWRTLMAPLFEQAWTFGREYDEQYGGRRELVFRRSGQHLVEAFWEAHPADSLRRRSLGHDERAALIILVDELKKLTKKRRGR